MHFWVSLAVSYLYTIFSIPVKWSNLLKRCLNLLHNFCITLLRRVKSVKLFIKFTNSFCKLGCFLIMNYFIHCTEMVKLSKECASLIQIFFLWSPPGLNPMKKFWSKYIHSFLSSAVSLLYTIFSVLLIWSSLQKECVYVLKH